MNRLWGYSTKGGHFNNFEGLRSTDNTPNLYKILELIYQDVVTTTKLFQMTHLGTYRDIAKVPVIPDMTALYPEHVFYVRKESELSTLLNGKLYFMATSWSSLTQTILLVIRGNSSHNLA